MLHTKKNLTVKVTPKVQSFRPQLEALEDRVLMSAGDVLFATYNQLYLGTPSGNTLLKDFGNETTVGGLTVVNSPAYVGSRVYFTTTSGVSLNNTYDHQLWVSDGTSAGTQEVHDFGTGTIGESSSGTINMAQIGDKIGLTLSPATGSADVQLWISNGTSSGTSMLEDFPNDTMQFRNSIGNQLYFTVTSTKPVTLGGSYETQLYITDGTYGDTFSVDKAYGPGSSTMYGFTTVGGLLDYFQTGQTRGANPELIETNGTPGGTNVVLSSPDFADIVNTVAIGYDLYFEARWQPDPNFPGTYFNELWVSHDNSSEQTTMLKEFGTNTFGNMVAAGNQVYFIVWTAISSNTNDGYLWTATLSGANELANPNYGVIGAVGNQLYFISVTPGDAQLYVSSGTPSTTNPAFDFGNAGTSNLAEIPIILGIGSQAYIFIDSAGSTNQEKLYASNGTAAGTVLLASLGAGFPSYPEVVSGSQLYFPALYFESQEVRLYTSDSTSTGTTYQDVPGASPDVAPPLDMVAILPVPGGGNGGGGGGNGGGGGGGGNGGNGGGGGSSSGGGAVSTPPSLNEPPLLAFFDSLLGGAETINANGTETLVDSFFGFPLLVSTFDSHGNLVSVDLFGSIDVTFLFG